MDKLGRRARALLVAGLLAGLCAGPGGVLLAQSQQGSQPPPAKPAPGQQPAQDQQPVTQPGTRVATQSAPASQATPKPSTAVDNPFPEEESKAAQKEATEEDRADRKAASAGPAATPGEADGSSSRDKLAGIDILGERDPRISNGAGGTVVDPKLGLKDLQVGQQYYSLGNYQGAYERFKEAVTVNPGNLDAVFYLAEAARKTAHLDESAENYRVYLEAQPDGGKAKAARKALGQLAAK